jgi:cysteine-rich repeat protein
MKKCILFILFFAMFFHFVSADNLNVNDGGSTGMIINPNTYMDEFFSGDNGVQVLSVCGNGILETPYEECDDGNTISGDGCSSTCKIEGPKPPTPPGPPGPGGISIQVDPMSINRSMLINSNIEENIGITNLDNSSSANFSISSSDFDPNLIVSFWDTKSNAWVGSFLMILSAGQITDLRVRFSAPADVGTYNGTINIDGKKVSVNLIVQEKLLLFDSNIIVLNDNYLVPQGDQLRTSVTLIPLGDKERMDVTLNYVIKDYNNRIYLTRSETVLVENQVNFKRNFDTGFLPVGSYIIGLELIYPNGVAPSSAHFEVTQGRQNTFFGKVVFFLINAILIVLILIILLIILRIIKQMRESRKSKEKEKNIERWKAENNENPGEKSKK